MLYIAQLLPEEQLTLEEMHKNHPAHAPRIRAHAVLLNNSGFKLKEISAIFGVCRQTAATWLNSWENNGICGLLDDFRSGRPPKLPEENKDETLQLIIESPRSLKTVIAQLSEKFNIELSCSTLKRLCKQANLCWKRVRKSLKSKRNPKLFAQSQQQLADLIEQDKQGLIDLVYFDQSGFTLEPCVPYAWQTKGETIEIPCSKSKRLNVLGFMGRDCSFQSMVFEGSITSAVVVACIDNFLETHKHPTALVIDNASIHTSHEFLENIGRWKSKGLAIVPISPYSPELNLIEILWRKIKYEWMPFSAYGSFLSLKQNLFDILANIGKTYTINFA
jgi:transposase